MEQVQQQQQQQPPQPPQPTLEEAIRAVGQLQVANKELADANAALQARLNQLQPPAQAPTQPPAQAPMQPAQYQAQMHPGQFPSMPKVKPDKYEGKGNLEGWLSSTRDILVRCYGHQLQNGAIVMNASLFLGGTARTSWDARVMAYGEAGGFYAWEDFAHWLRETHGTAEPQVVQGQLLLRLKQEGKSLQDYINRWQSIYAQLPTPLPMDYQKAIFVEGLNNKFFGPASEFRLRHKECSLQDIMVYLRSMSLQGGRGETWAPKREAKGDPMDVDLKSLQDEIKGLHKQLQALSNNTSELHRLTAEEVQEYKRKGLCFACGKAGHMQASCTNPRKNGKRGA